MMPDLTSFARSGHGADGRRPRAVHLAVVLAAVGGGSALLVVWLGALAGVDQFELLADPNDVSDRPPYTGLVSQAGVLVWTAGAAVAGAAAAHTGSAVLRDLALLTALLALDDVFLVHDHVLPVPEVVFFAALAAGALWLARRHAAELLRDRAGPVVVTAVALLAGSVIADVSMLDKVTAVSAVVEETLKLAGIATWTGALVLLSRDRTLGPEAVPGERRGAAASAAEPLRGRGAPRR